jgi:prefoldin subunit 5
MRTRGELDEAVKKLEASKGKDSKDIEQLKNQIDGLYERVAALEKPRKTE